MRIGLVIWIFSYLPTANTSRFKFTNIECESFDKNFFELKICRLKAIARYKTVINLDGTLKQTVNNVLIRGEMFKRANGYKPWLYNRTVEGCQFYQKANDPVAKLVFNLFKPYSNFNHSCPYEPGPIRIWGFYLFAENIPVPMPSGDYLVKLLWSVNNSLKFVSKTSFSFQEDFNI